MSKISRLGTLPPKLTLQQRRTIGKSIAAWWTGKGSLPEPFETNVSKDRKIYLITLDGRGKYLGPGGIEGKPRPCWINFEEAENGKIVHIYETDKMTLVNSFYLVKDGQIIKISNSHSSVRKTIN